MVMNVPAQLSPHGAGLGTLIDGFRSGRGDDLAHLSALHGIERAAG